MEVRSTENVRVRVAEADARGLIHALLQTGASVRIRGAELEIRGLSACRVALVAAGLLAGVTDLVAVPGFTAAGRGDRFPC